MVRGKKVHDDVFRLLAWYLSTTSHWVVEIADDYSMFRCAGVSNISVVLLEITKATTHYAWSFIPLVNMSQATLVKTHFVQSGSARD